MVALALPGTDEVHKVSIIPRGVGALGYTIQRPTEDRFLMKKTELENKMAVMMGGRARNRSYSTRSQPAQRMISCVLPTLPEPWCCVMA